jgi:outer membrane protein
MKQISILFMVLILISISSITFSQSILKIGHVDINELMASLPERDSAQVLLDKETKEIQATYEEMKVMVNIQLEEYQKNLSSYTELVKKAKEAEIYDKQRRLQEFEQNASLSLQQRNIELFQPIYDKIISAIEKVATNNGFTYILDVSKGSVVYTSKDSQNINQLVLSLLKK